ncbi:MAG: hypothetical protein ACR2MB_05680 [Acidimicrobiales bacterium]
MQNIQVYGLDIETDTSRDALDPVVASVRAVGLSTQAGDELFVGDEDTLLADLDARLADLPRGVLATWNGGAFDLPFLADRARLIGVSIGLRLRLDRALALHRTPLPGHAGAYRGAWHGHSHIDTYRLYGPPSGTRSSLRSVGRLLGVGGASGRQVRRADLTNEALHAHAPSDARLARVLAERRWPAAARMLDHVDAHEAEHVAVAERRAARKERIEAVGSRARIATV